MNTKPDVVIESVPFFRQLEEIASQMGPESAREVYHDLASSLRAAIDEAFKIHYLPDKAVRYHVRQLRRWYDHCLQQEQLYASR